MSKMNFILIKFKWKHELLLHESKEGEVIITLISELQSNKMSFMLFKLLQIN